MWASIGPLLLLLLAAGGVGAAAAGDETSAPVPVSPELVSEVLDNGLRVTILPDPRNTVVATQVWYHVGSANEEPHSRGFAHLFEHLMFGETENHARDDYAGHHHRHGGYENAFTSEDETVYVSEIAPGHHREVLAMEADRMVHLVLGQENLDNEKKIVSEELRVRMENDPFIRVLIAARQAAFGDHPYAHSPGGTRDDVGAATLEHCRAFYQRYYRPGNTHLVIAGPVDGPATLAEVRRQFGAIPAGGITPPDVPPVAGVAFPERIALREDLPPVETALLAFPLPEAGTADRWAIEVMQHLLGGGAVDLFEDALVSRRRKAVYAMTERLQWRRGGVLLFMAASLPYRREATAFRLMEETLADLTRLDWLTEESLRGAKRTLVRRTLAGVYYPAQRADAIGRAQWWHGDAGLALERAERIERVTREEVATAFRRYVGEAAPVRVYIRPERVPVRVRLFGWLYPLVHR